MLKIKFLKSFSVLTLLAGLVAPQLTHAQAMGTQECVGTGTTLGLPTGIGGTPGSDPTDPTGTGTGIGGVCPGVNGGAGQDPLVLDLNFNGLHLTDITEKEMHFDYGETSPNVLRTSWYGAGEQLLVLERVLENDKVENIMEVFGNATVDGFDEMAEVLDENKDGLINKKDPLWSRLKIWTDANGDAKTDSNEMKSLASYDVVEINLKDQKKLEYVQNHQFVSRESTFTLKDGRTGTVNSVWFVTEENTRRHLEGEVDTNHTDAFGNTCEDEPMWIIAEGFPCVGELEGAAGCVEASDGVTRLHERTALRLCVGPENLQQRGEAMWEAAVVAERCDTTDVLNTDEIIDPATGLPCNTVTGNLPAPVRVPAPAPGPNEDGFDINNITEMRENTP